MIYAISPIDGRYQAKTKGLSPFFSEAALIRYRVIVEVHYLIALAELNIGTLASVDKSTWTSLDDWAKRLSEKDILRVKEIETKTNHDVKAVEYLLKEQLIKLGLETIVEYTHFGLTSQDINNTAFPMMIGDGLKKQYLPTLAALISSLTIKAQAYRETAILCRTHGQPATPSTMGMQFMVFVDRLQQESKKLEGLLPLYAKFGGATGAFNAHVVSYPDIDWIAFADRFVQSLGLRRSRYTTQIAHYDHLAAVFHSMSRIHSILIDLCRDIWTYISMDYFTQSILKDEVGSSAMPHKVNPIDFENAEGNLGMANSVLSFLASSLPVSRLQRDLTDSTVLRNVGVPFAHAAIAMASLDKGLNKIKLNQNQLKKDLEDNWAIVAEAIQTILRREQYPEPYEALKKLTRKNQKITQSSLAAFIDGLEISHSLKEELHKISPHNYLGMSDKF